MNAQSLGRGCRAKIPSTPLRDFVTNVICRLDPSPSSLATSDPSGTPYPITHYVNYDNFSVHHRHFLVAISAGNEPRSVAESMKDKRWRQAMQAEIQALESNGTWNLESIPPGKKAVGCK